MTSICSDASFVGQSSADISPTVAATDKASCTDAEKQHAEQAVPKAGVSAAASAGSTAARSTAVVLEMNGDTEVWSMYKTLEEVDAELGAIAKRQEQREKEGSTLEGREMLTEMMRTGWPTSTLSPHMQSPPLAESEAHLHLLRARALVDHTNHGDHTNHDSHDEQPTDQAEQPSSQLDHADQQSNALPNLATNNAGNGHMDAGTGTDDGTGHMDDAGTGHIDASTDMDNAKLASLLADMASQPDASLACKLCDELAKHAQKPYQHVEGDVPFLPRVMNPDVMFVQAIQPVMQLLARFPIGDITAHQDVAYRCVRFLATMASRADRDLQRASIAAVLDTLQAMACKPDFAKFAYLLTQTSLVVNHKTQIAFAEMGGYDVVVKLMRSHACCCAMLVVAAEAWFTPDQLDQTSTHQPDQPYQPDQTTIRTGLSEYQSMFLAAGLLEAVVDCCADCKDPTIQHYAWQVLFYIIRDAGLATVAPAYTKRFSQASWDQYALKFASHLAMIGDIHHHALAMPKGLHC